jgi:hypothetical protein
LRLRQRGCEHVLASFQTPDIRIAGTGETFNEATATILGPLAPRLLVGVDHIPSRWAAQRAAASRWSASGPAPVCLIGEQSCEDRPIILLVRRAASIYRQDIPAVPQ